MSEDVIRVRVVYDEMSSDPRCDDGFICEIRDRNRSNNMLVEAISMSNSFRVKIKLLKAVDEDAAYDAEAYLHHDMTTRERLDLIETMPDELHTIQFDTRNDVYVALTRRSQIDEAGISWDKVGEAMQGDIETFSQWVEGEVYGYIVEKQVGEDEWEEIESCWGFYGSDRKINGMTENIAPEYVDMLLAAEVE